MARMKQPPLSAGTRGKAGCGLGALLELALVATVFKIAEKKLKLY